MVVIKSNLGWKVKDFREITFEEIEAKFTIVWKQIKNFIPMGSKEEAKRFKRKGIRFEQESVKKLKTSKEVKASEQVPEEKVKEMMQLVPIEEVYVEALQVKHPIIDWKHLDREDLNQLWTLVKESLNIRPALIECKLYDTCGVHHVTAKDKETFMLVEKDYPLRKGLAIGRIVGNKMHKPFPLLEEVPTASEETSHCQKKRDATAIKIAVLLKSRTKTKFRIVFAVTQSFSHCCTLRLLCVIILTSIDNDIYSIVDACPNACEMWKAIERLKQGESINVQDIETNLYWKFGKFTSREGESLESYYSRSQQTATKNKGKVIVNSCTPTYDQEPPMVVDDDEIANPDNTLRINKGTRYDNQREINVVVAWKNVEAYYLYVAHFQEVTPDAADDPGPIFDVEPLQKVQNDDDDKYNMFANEREHPEQPESFNDTYPDEQDEHNIIINSLDMSHDREQDDQDDDDIAKEHDLLASLIKKLKCDIDDNKNHNKILESSNDTLVDKLKGEIKDFKTKNKSLESSNNHFKEANNEMSKTNQLMFKDLKKFQAKLDRYHDVNYALKWKLIV
nr:hypothetical protein [Tanacetum cinerariifolium]